MNAPREEGSFYHWLRDTLLCCHRGRETPKKEWRINTWGELANIGHHLQ